MRATSQFSVNPVDFHTSTSRSFVCVTISMAANIPFHLFLSSDIFNNNKHKTKKTTMLFKLLKPHCGKRNLNPSFRFQFRFIRIRLVGFVQFKFPFMSYRGRVCVAGRHGMVEQRANHSCDNILLW